MTTDDLAIRRVSDGVVTLDRFVAHVSTVAANRGQLVGLHLREKVQQTVVDRGGAPVVLFVHGGFSPSVVAYDLDYKDYSWMAQLAAAGFDVFAMTHTGYGASPRPLMDDPCNVDAAFQDQLIPHVLKSQTPPRYACKMVTSRTEWDEIETVVDYILRLRAVERLSLIGWSTGCPRAGGYAALHPEKVDKLVLFAPTQFGFFRSEEPPAVVPEPGAPMILQSREMLMERRWADNVGCESQIEHPEVREIMWHALMAEDVLGAQWGRDGIGVMRAPSRMYFGWRTNVARIAAPTLVMLGEFDNFEQRLDAWKALRCEDRVFIKIACGSHFLQYERNRRVLHAASREWLTHGSIGGERRAELCADRDGRLSALAPPGVRT